MKKLLIPVIIIIVAIIGYSSYLIYDLRTVIANGTVKVENAENIMIDFPAFIKSVYVEEGERVKRNQPLMQLDLGQYQAEIAKKEQELRNLQNDLQQAGTELSQLENDIANAEATLELSKDILKDKEKLFEQGVVSRYELENVRKETRADETRLTNLKQAMVAKTQGITTRQVLQENIDGTQFQLQALKNRFSLSYIKNGSVVAPVSGVVCEIGYRGGDVVDKEKKLLSILNDERIYVNVNVSELLIKDIRLGSKTAFTPAAYDSFLPLADRREYSGKVAAISNVVVTNGNERFFSVKVVIDHPDRYLVPNLSGKVKFYRK